MKPILAGISALALASTLSTCGGTDVPANNVMAANDMNATMADSGPFAEAETQMDRAMRAAVGVSAADSWVRKMIEHHKGAIAMSRILLDQNVSGHVADMARQTIAKQSAEVTGLEKLVANGTPDPASAAIYQPAAIAMHNAMMAAQGSDIADTWVRKMLEHHKGAVAMSDIALANGASGAVRAQIEKTKAGQQKEIEHIEGMLSGRQPAAQSAAAPPTQPPRTQPTAARPAPKPPAKPEPAPRPTEPKPNPDPECAPEHRAAGHC